MNLEIGIIVEVDPVSVSLSKLSEGSSFLKLISEFDSVVVMKLVKVVGAAN